MARTDSSLLRNVSRTFARFFLDRGYSIDDVTSAMRIACHEYVRARAAIDGTNIKAVAAKLDVNDRAVRRYTNNKASLKDLYEVTMLAFFRARPMKPMTAENAALFLLRDHNKIALGAENEGIDPRDIAAALERKRLLKSSLVGSERVYFAEGGHPVGEGDELAALWTFGSPEMANVVTALESYFDADPARSAADDDRFLTELLENIETQTNGGESWLGKPPGVANAVFAEESPKSRLRVVAAVAAAAALFGVFETRWLTRSSDETVKSASEIIWASTPQELSSGASSEASFSSGPDGRLVGGMSMLPAGSGAHSAGPGETCDVDMCSCDGRTSTSICTEDVSSLATKDTPAGRERPFPSKGSPQSTN